MGKKAISQISRAISVSSLMFIGCNRAIGYQSGMLPLSQPITKKHSHQDHALSKRHPHVPTSPNFYIPDFGGCLVGKYMTRTPKMRPLIPLKERAVQAIGQVLAICNNDVERFIVDVIFQVYPTDELFRHMAPVSKNYAYLNLSMLCEIAKAWQGLSPSDQNYPFAEPGKIAYETIISAFRSTEHAYKMASYLQNQNPLTVYTAAVTQALVHRGKTNHQYRPEQIQHATHQLQEKMKRICTACLLPRFVTYQKNRDPSKYQKVYPSLLEIVEELTFMLKAGQYLVQMKKPFGYNRAVRQHIEKALDYHCVCPAIAAPPQTSITVISGGQITNAKQIQPKTMKQAAMPSTITNQTVHTAPAESKLSQHPEIAAATRKQVRGTGRETIYLSEYTAHTNVVNQHLHQAYGLAKEVPIQSNWSVPATQVGGQKEKLRIKKPARNLSQACSLLEGGIPPPSFSTAVVQASKRRNIGWYGCGMLQEQAMLSSVTQDSKNLHPTITPARRCTQFLQLTLTKPVQTTQQPEGSAVSEVVFDIQDASQDEGSMLWYAPEQYLEELRNSYGAGLVDEVVKKLNGYDTVEDMDEHYDPVSTQEGARILLEVAQKSEFHKKK